MKELQTALKGFVKQNETLKIETKVSKLKIVSPTKNSVAIVLLALSHLTP